jgi:hypothetical protein
MAESNARLASRLKARNGTSAVYRRGNYSVSLTVVIGSQLLRVSDRQGNVKMERADADFLIEASDLVLNGSATEPASGDYVDVSIGSETKRYELMPVGSEPAWRYADPTGQSQYRVHTKFRELL